MRIETVAADPAAAERAIAAAFQAVAAVESAQSFHDPRSELSRINAAAPGERIPLSAATAAVLRTALGVAQASEGAFDPVVAAMHAVARGALPRPVGRAADPSARWRDVELAPDGTSLRLMRPVWIDLGGVAKGYAVDLAVEALRGLGASSGSVDAGGDLRVFGAPSTVALDARAPQAPVPRLELIETALASSGGLTRCVDLSAPTPVDGRDGRDVAHAFAAVIAPRCRLADALTKVVLALGREAAPVLDAFGAHAYRLAACGDWMTIGEGAA